jgi:uncharacterized caspase-like protein
MKYALIIGNNKYDDPKLAQLKTPAADSQALAKLLGDQTIGSFDQVTPLINKTETQVRRAISTFLGNKKPDDLILLYFSGHGVLDDRGRLYLALRDTQVNLLKATSIPSSFVADEMDSCRSKRQILILDCCHSGAFARGVKGEQKAITETTFEGSGFGRVVLTASDSTQYALEGDQVIKQTELSLFTHFLLDGLKTGEADINNDGQVSLDEWYDYTYTRVISETPRQVPHKWSYNQQGDLIIARNPFVKKKVVELPAELVHALESSFVGIRESAVQELGKYLSSRDPEMATLAVSSLEKMKTDDSRRISSLAERLLSEFERTRAPESPPGAPSQRTPTDAVPETIHVASSPSPSSGMLDETALPPVQKMMAENGSYAATAHSEIDPRHVQNQTPAVSEKLGDDALLWFKWIAIAVLGFAILKPLSVYLYDNKVLEFIPGLYAVLIGLLSTVQWRAFRNRLGSWWIAANMAGCIILGGLNNYLYYEHDSWVKDPLFNVAILLNVALGTILLWRGRAKPGDAAASPSGEAVAAFAEIDPRRNIFGMLLSIFLVLFGFLAVIIALSDADIWYASEWFTKTAWILSGITSILAGIAFFLVKETPRTFGLLALAIFLLLNGVMVELFAFQPDSSLFFFHIPGMMALLAGVFFVSQKETWRTRRSMALSGYLILVGLLYFGIDDFYDIQIINILTAIFALLAGAFFFLRK